MARGTSWTSRGCYLYTEWVSWSALFLLLVFSVKKLCFPFLESMFLLTLSIDFPILFVPVYHSPECYLSIGFLACTDRRTIRRKPSLMHQLFMVIPIVFTHNFIEWCDKTPVKDLCRRVSYFGGFIRIGLYKTILPTLLYWRQLYARCHPFSLDPFQ